MYIGLVAIYLRGRLKALTDRRRDSLNNNENTAYGEGPTLWERTPVRVFETN